MYHNIQSPNCQQSSNTAVKKNPNKNAMSKNKCKKKNFNSNNK